MGFATGFDLLFKISGEGKALLLSAMCLGTDLTKAINEKIRKYTPLILLNDRGFLTCLVGSDKVRVNY